jgi:hypothetical protein
MSYMNDLFNDSSQTPVTQMLNFVQLRLNSLNIVCIVYTVDWF